jgi:hypothetical protein
MNKSFPKPFFWVTNASPMNVTLADLAVNIRAFSTVNLLDERHYKYTLDQLLKSEENGSIFKKRDRIKVRTLPPPDPKKEELPILRETVMPSRERSLFVIETKEYDELKFDDKDIQKQDEEYAKENADLAEMDAMEYVKITKRV